jgi:hypothetical protein
MAVKFFSKPTKERTIQHLVDLCLLYQKRSGFCQAGKTKSQAVKDPCSSGTRKNHRLAGNTGLGVVAGD